MQATKARLPSTENPPFEEEEEKPPFEEEEVEKPPLDEAAFRDLRAAPIRALLCEVLLRDLARLIEWLAGEPSYDLSATLPQPEIFDPPPVVSAPCWVFRERVILEGRPFTAAVDWQTETVFFLSVVKGTLGAHVVPVADLSEFLDQAERSRLKFPPHHVTLKKRALADLVRTRAVMERCCVIASSRTSWQLVVVCVNETVRTYRIEKEPVSGCLTLRKEQALRTGGRIKGVQARIDSAGDLELWTIRQFKLASFTLASGRWSEFTSVELPPLRDGRLDVSQRYLLLTTSASVVPLELVVLDLETKEIVCRRACGAPEACPEPPRVFIQRDVILVVLPRWKKDMCTFVRGCPPFEVLHWCEVEPRLLGLKRQVGGNWFPLSTRFFNVWLVHDHVFRERQGRELSLLHRCWSNEPQQLFQENDRL